MLNKTNYKDILGNIDDKDDRQKLTQGDQSVPIPPQEQRHPTTTASDISDLTPPKPTGIKSVDDKNWDDYIKLLEIYAPHMVVEKLDIIDGGVVTKIKPEIIEIDDVVPTEPWLRPKTEEDIIEIDDVAPTEPWQRAATTIPQETVKLPRPIPKTDLPENIDHISAISDIIKISTNQFDNVDGDLDFNVVEQM